MTNKQKLVNLFFYAKDESVLKATAELMLAEAE